MEDLLLDLSQTCNKLDKKIESVDVKQLNSKSRPMPSDKSITNLEALYRNISTLCDKNKRQIRDLDSRITVIDSKLNYPSGAKIVKTS